MPVCHECGSWEPSSREQCSRCGGALEPIERPAVSDDRFALHSDLAGQARVIAAYFGARPGQLGRASGARTGSGALALAESLRDHPDERVAILWRAWGRGDLWWPDWEAEEELDVAIRGGLDAGALLDLALSWVDTLQTPSPAHAIARELKTRARVIEREERRSPSVPSHASPGRSSIAARLRQASVRARNADMADTCERIVRADRVASVVARSEHLLVDLATREPFDPAKLLTSLAEEAEKAPRPSEEEGVAGGCLYAATVAGVVVFAPLVEAVRAAIGRLKTALKARRR
jgi:hypothetical protein